jgi:hypothetical protein
MSKPKLKFGKTRLGRSADPDDSEQSRKAAWQQRLALSCFLFWAKKEAQLILRTRRQWHLRRAPLVHLVNPLAGSFRYLRFFSFGDPAVSNREAQARCVVAGSGRAEPSEHGARRTHIVFLAGQPLECYAFRDVGFFVPLVEYGS